jgi:flagellar protein FliO/FliZ
MTGTSTLQFISVLIIFILVLAATYFVTKWLADYQRGTGSTGKNISIIETCRISQTKYIQIIRIGNRYTAIAVSKDQVTSLGDVPEEDLIIKEDGQENISFKEMLEKIKGEKKS